MKFEEEEIDHAVRFGYANLLRDPDHYGKMYFKKNEEWWFYSLPKIMNRILRKLVPKKMYKRLKYPERQLDFGMDYAVPGTLGGLGQSYVQPNLP